MLEKRWVIARKIQGERLYLTCPLNNRPPKGYHWSFHADQAHRQKKDELPGQYENHEAVVLGWEFLTEDEFEVILVIEA